MLALELDLVLEGLLRSQRPQKPPGHATDGGPRLVIGSVEPLGNEHRA